jgi:hydroxypyruvate reductase 1
MNQKNWEIHNPAGNKRVIVTKKLPGTLWLERLTRAGCKVKICTSTDVLSVEEIKAAMGTQCDGVLGQLTEDWGDELFAALKAAGGTAYSNVAVGYNNVDVDAATTGSINGNHCSNGGNLNICRCPAHR